MKFIDKIGEQFIESPTPFVMVIIALMALYCIVALNAIGNSRWDEDHPGAGPVLIDAVDAGWRPAPPPTKPTER